jgi:putative addiction module component (TIGR02574 family)
MTMTAALEQVIPIIAELTAEDREVLRGILDELDGDVKLSPREWEAAWMDECGRRMADLKAGRTKLVSWDEIEANWAVRG